MDLEKERKIALELGFDEYYNYLSVICTDELELLINFGVIDSKLSREEQLKKFEEYTVNKDAYEVAIYNLFND